jgi:hypothetical protein
MQRVERIQWYIDDCNNKILLSNKEEYISNQEKYLQIFNETKEVILQYLENKK